MKLKEKTMKSIVPHFRETGSGPTVICLHSSTSSSKQWQPLSELLAGEFRVVGIDLLGYGRSPEWVGRRRLRLYDEVALLDEFVGKSDRPVHLVGHSYGGAVAMAAARRYGDRAASVALYEPVLFNLLRSDSAALAAAAEIEEVELDVRKHVDDGNPGAAARRFISYWVGQGAWEGLPDWQREVITGRMRKVVADFQATLGSRTPLGQYARLNVPVLLMAGTESPLSTRTITGILSRILPDVTVCRIDGAGHMGPVSHPAAVNSVLAEFLRVPSGRVRTPSRVA